MDAFISYSVQILLAQQQFKLPRYRHFKLVMRIHQLTRYRCFPVWNILRCRNSFSDCKRHTRHWFSSVNCCRWASFFLALRHCIITRIKIFHLDEERITCNVMQNIQKLHPYISSAICFKTYPSLHSLSENISRDWFLVPWKFQFQLLLLCKLK